MHVGKLEAQILDLLALELGHEGRDPVLGHDFPLWSAFLCGDRRRPAQLSAGAAEPSAAPEPLARYYGAGIQFGVTSAPSVSWSSFTPIIVTVFCGTRLSPRIGDRTGDAGIALGRGERVADLGRILRAGALDGVGDQPHRVVAERREGVLRLCAVGGFVVGVEFRDRVRRAGGSHEGVGGIVDVIRRLAAHLKAGAACRSRRRPRSAA